MAGINTVNNRRPKLPKFARRFIQRLVRKFVFLSLGLLVCYSVWDAFSALRAAGGLRDWTMAFGFNPGRRIP